MTKCCECGTTISDEEKEKIIKEFNLKICDTIDKFTQIPDTAIAAQLIFFAKDLVCSRRFSYTLTLGILQEMLTDELKELWESNFDEEEEEKEECNQSLAPTAE